MKRIEVYVQDDVRVKLDEIVKYYASSSMTRMIVAMVEEYHRLMLEEKAKINQ